MDCKIDHIVLNMEKEEEMINFYTKILMLAPERLADYHSGSALFPSVRLNDVTVIDLFPKKLWSNNDTSKTHYSNLNHFCIALSKHFWNDLLNRLIANGIDIAEGPVTRWGARGDGTSIYFRDPEGNMIEARYYD